jgi:SAM-dependent methyltransferase
MPFNAPLRYVVASLFCTAVVCLPALARDVTAEDCQRDFRPYSGQSGKDVVWVPTPDDTVHRMLTLAGVGPEDFVVDLGAGDGKIPISAARDFGARAVGIEYNEHMVRLAQCNARAAGVANSVRIVQGDIFEADFSEATVVTLYLLPELNLRLRPTLLAMRPGTRIVSHDFGMDDWEPDERAIQGSDSVFLWIVPARVDGSWDFRPRRGGSGFTVTLRQTFQMIAGEIEANGVRRPLERASLRGAQLYVAFLDDSGQTRTLSGSVAGDRIEASLSDPAGKAVRYRGRRIG